MPDESPWTRNGTRSRHAGAAPQPLAVDAVLFDLDGTLADTAPDLAAALNRVRSDRGLESLPLRALRPYASHGARGLLAAGMGVDPDQPMYEALRTAFLDHYAAALCVESTLFAEVAALLDALDARALRWGIVTNKANASPRRCSMHWVFRPGPARWCAGTRRPISSRIPRRSSSRPGVWASRRRDACTSAMPNATSSPEPPRGWRRSSRATATSNRRTCPGTGRERHHRLAGRAARLAPCVAVTRDKRPR